MAEFPCAAMRRRLFDPPKSIHLFIENHREFIEFYRYIQDYRPIQAFCPIMEPC